MSSLLIRNVDDALHAQLKARARAHRRSLDEEARELLRSAVARDASAAPADGLVGIAERLFGAEHGVDLVLPPRRSERQRPPPDFSKPRSKR